MSPCLSLPGWIRLLPWMGLLFGGSLLWQPALAEPAAPAQDGLVMLTLAPDLPDSSAKTVQARVMIEAPPQLVWETLTNYPAIKHILPGYEKSSVVRDNGANKQVALSTRVVSFLPPFKYKVNVHEDLPAWQISFTRAAGDFRALDMTYKLIPQANGARTLLAYQLTLDPGMDIPGGGGMLRSSTKKSLRALERHIEQEARKRLIGQR